MDGDVYQRPAKRSKFYHTQPHPPPQQQQQQQYQQQYQQYQQHQQYQHQPPPTSTTPPFYAVAPPRLYEQHICHPDQPAAYFGHAPLLPLNQAPLPPPPRPSPPASAPTPLSVDGFPPPSIEELPPPGDFWVDTSLYALDAAPEIPASHPDATDWVLSQDERENGFGGGGEQDDQAIQSWISNQLPFLFSVELPQLEDRHVDLDIPNPFDDGSLVRFTDQAREKRVVPVDGAINSYIKFRIRQTDMASPEPPRMNSRRLSMSSNSSQVSNSNLPPAIVPYLPPNFGKKWNLDETDKKLLRFYLVAFCNGRTVLPKANAYLDIASIAEQDEGVKHALLSLAAGYVLDYVPTPHLQARANHHHKKAVGLLTDALRDPDTQAVGKGDAAVAACVLLFTDDTVQWETTPNPRGRDAMPRWLAGAQVARSILDKTDEGYRYWNAVNVQTTDARYSNANMIAYFNIIAEPVMPLRMSETDRMYSWLLEGTSREVRKINGTSSLSPKLLHTYAQITHLAAKLAEKPNSTVLPHGARRIETRLKAFRQWSDLSEGYPSVEALFAACELDENGKVSTAALVTDLTGQTYVQTALLYLYCRFFRYPRSHPKVLAAMEIACGCLDRMPYNGPLFTAQSPFFPIVLMCLISYRERERRSLTNWFSAVLSDAGARSSVPPVWKTIQRMWTWFEEEMPIVEEADAEGEQQQGHEHEHEIVPEAYEARQAPTKRSSNLQPTTDTATNRTRKGKAKGKGKGNGTSTTFDEVAYEATAIGDRFAWWEVMVERLLDREGVLCLA